MQPHNNDNEKKEFKTIQNPYNSGNPIKSGEMFYGREDELDQIYGGVTTDSCHVILLIGGRRAGKTSILHQLEGGKFKENAETVWCDFNEFKKNVANDKDFIKAIGNAVLKNPIFKTFNSDFELAEKSNINLQKLLKNCVNLIAPKKLLILCDEFDSLDPHFENAILSEQALSWVQYALKLPICFIMASSHEFNEKNIKNAFNANVKTVKIDEFSKTDTFDLIQTPCQGKLNYDEEALEKIYRLSGGFPYYIQTLCEELINRINTKLKRVDIDADDLDAVVEFILTHTPGHIDETINFFQITPQKLSVLAALAHTIKDSEKAVNVTAILAVAKQKNFKVNQNDCLQVLADLSNENKSKLLKYEKKTDSYQFRSDLLREIICYKIQNGFAIESRKVIIEELPKNYGDVPVSRPKNRSKKYLYVALAGVLLLLGAGVAFKVYQDQEQKRMIEIQIHKKQEEEKERHRKENEEWARLLEENSKPSKCETKPNLLADLRKSGVIKVAMEISAPFYYLENKTKQMGFGYEFAVELSKKLGIKSGIIVTSGAFDKLPSLIRAAESADIAIAGYIKEDIPNVSWSDSFLETGLTLITKEGSAITNLNALKGKKIGLYKGDNPTKEWVISQGVLERDIDATQDESDNWLDNLQNNKWDAVIYDYVFAVEALKNEKYKYLRMKAFNLGNHLVEYSIILPCNNDDLVHEVNGKIKEIKASTFYRDLKIKYFKADKKTVQTEAIVGCKNCYIVKKWDYLSTIAEKQLGDQSRAMEIFELNKDRIASSELINVGDELKMPAK